MSYLSHTLLMHGQRKVHQHSHWTSYPQILDFVFREKDQSSYIELWNKKYIKITCKLKKKVVVFKSMNRIFSGWTNTIILDVRRGRLFKCVCFVSKQEKIIYSLLCTIINQKEGLERNLNFWRLKEAVSINTTSLQFFFPKGVRRRIGEGEIEREGRGSGEGAGTNYRWLKRVTSMKLIIVIFIRANPAKFSNTVKVSNCR